MPSNVMVSGKHPVIVRVEADVYDRLCYYAASVGKTPNQVLAGCADDIASGVKLPKGWKES